MSDSTDSWSDALVYGVRIRTTAVIRAMNSTTFCTCAIVKSFKKKRIYKSNQYAADNWISDSNREFHADQSNYWKLSGAQTRKSSMKSAKP